MVSASLSNQEIGERLFVSRRTVETHVSDTLSKPGFTTRELIAAVRDGRPGISSRCGGSGPAVRQAMMLVMSS